MRNFLMNDAKAHLLTDTAEVLILRLVVEAGQV